MRSTLVLLVRHGQTPTTDKILPGQAPGLHLAEAGQRQADMVAARIDRLPKVAAVYASHLERARETALPIARLRGLDGALLDTQLVGHGPAAVAFDGEMIWVTNSGSRTVSRR